jgi:hypothetical protein
MINIKLETLTYVLTILIPGISVAFATIIKIKSLKLPQIVETSRLLTENVFAWGIVNIEPNLYHDLNPQIQKNLKTFKHKYSKYFIYFDRDLLHSLDKICNANIQKDKKVPKSLQIEYKNFSFYYLQAVKISRRNLGLSKYKYNYRIKNNLYQHPKTSFILGIVDTALISLTLLSLGLFIFSLNFFPALSPYTALVAFLIFYLLALFHLIL